MVPEDKINEFVKRVREAAGPNLESVILFGSAVSGDFHPGMSDLNMFCVLRDSSFAALQALAPVAKWWDRQKQPPPLCMTRRELERSTDVFTIELLDMQQHHRVLFGEDVVQGLRISMHVHRVQVEYELREKLILLRQQVLLASGNDSRLWELLQRSVASFATLFRHALIALGDEAPAGRRQALQALSTKMGFDLSPVYQLLDVREHKTDPKKIQVSDLAARYLAAIEKVTAAVDEALDSDASGEGVAIQIDMLEEKDMGKGLIAIIVIVVLLLGVLAFFGQYVSVKNTLVTKNEAVKSAWSQVDVVLQRRADLIPNLVETVKGYAKQEQTVFGDIAKARSALLSAGSPQEKIAANGQLDGAIGRLLAIVENYPQLKSNENFLRLQDELAGTENRIAVERKRYNDTLQDYNTYVQQFPASIFAGWAGFKPNAAYFTASEGAREVPKVNFSSPTSEAPQGTPQPAPAH